MPVHHSHASVFSMIIHEMGTFFNSGRRGTGGNRLRTSPRTQTRREGAVTQDAEGIIEIPGAAKEFRLNADFEGCVSFEELRHELAESVENNGGIAKADVSAVFCKLHIKRPMQRILDTPMRTLHFLRKNCFFRFSLHPSCRFFLDNQRDSH